jgi:nicotinate phosphoribosyltransferase
VNINFSCVTMSGHRCKHSLSGKQLTLTNRTDCSHHLVVFSTVNCRFPHKFLVLVDTYDTVRSGIPNFTAVALTLHKLGYAPVGIRLDSGDLICLSCRARSKIVSYAQRISNIIPSAPSMAQALLIMASSDLNVQKLSELRKVPHAIDAYGIGTELVTCQAQSALGCVYKLAELDGSARIKISEDSGKTSIPGAKNVYRIFSSSNSASQCSVVDVMTSCSEDPPSPGKKFSFFEYSPSEDIGCQGRDLPCRTVVPMLVEDLMEVVWRGKVGAGDLPSQYGTREYLETARRRCKVQLSACYSPDTPGMHMSGISPGLLYIVRETMSAMQSLRQ